MLGGLWCEVMNVFVEGRDICFIFYEYINVCCSRLIFLIRCLLWVISVWGFMILNYGVGVFV